jgi:DNA replication protein DnaC
MKELKNILPEAFEQLKTKPQSILFQQLTPDEFKKFVIKYGTKLVLEENVNRQFEVDESNRNALNQLYYYVTGNEKFPGDLSKGLLFIGGFGSGKTTLAKLIMIIYAMQTNKITKFLSTVDVQNLYKDDELFNNPYKNIETSPLIIDELGREEDKIMIYGTTHRPIEELIQRRYNKQAFTIATSNYNLDTLRKKYSDFVADRLKQMLNVIILDGKSRRK